MGARTIQVLAALGFFAVLGILGDFDYADSLSSEADAKLQRAALISAAADVTLLLSHPLPYTAIVCQSDYGEQPTCRYYMRKQ